MFTPIYRWYFTLSIESIELLEELCIYGFKLSLEEPLTIPRLPGPLRNIETLIGVGLNKEACSLIHQLEEHISDKMTVESYLYAVKNREQTEKLLEIRISRLLILEIIPSFCDKTMSQKERNDLIVNLITPYSEADWLSEALIGLSDLRFTPKLVPLA